MSWVTTTEVTPSSVWMVRISRAMVAEVIGSRPVVGSSNSTTSGSRASERASATRFFMPPDRSDGILSSIPDRRTMASFSATRSAISSSERSVCSRSGKAMFSDTVMESNSAPCWKSMAMRRRIG